MPDPYKSLLSLSGALRIRATSLRTSVMSPDVASTSPIGSSAARIIIFTLSPPQIQSLQAARKKS